jgi:predicted nucleic acid-binding protein
LDKKKVTIFIDTNVFIIDLRYRHDLNFKTNRNFLDFIARHDKGVTSLINLLEVCGILSFNLNQQQILELFYYFPEKYKVDIIPSYDMDSLLPETSVKAMMDIISQKASFGDALIANHANHFFKEKTAFVSWDAIHFKHLLSVKALTPREFLQSKEPLLK